MNKSVRKPSKILVDKGSEFYNRSMKLSLEDNDSEMHSTHNEGKSAAAENFFGSLKTKIYKNITFVSNNEYIDKLDDIVNKYNSTYHNTIKMMPVNEKWSKHTDFVIENNNKDHEHVRI